MTTNTKRNIEVWLYDNVFNNQKLDTILRMNLCSTYNNIKRKIRTIKSWSIFIKFWKIPTYIEDYNDAVNFAKCEIKDLRKVIERKEDQVEYLIETLATEYIDQQMSEDEAYREVYQMTYYDNWENRIPSKYLTDKEAEDKFDRDLDAHITHDPIGDAGYQELMDYELYRLKKGGVYEASY